MLISFSDLDYYNNTEDGILSNGEVSNCPWNTENKLTRIDISTVHEPDQSCFCKNLKFYFFILKTFYTFVLIKVRCFKNLLPITHHHCSYPNRESH